MFSQAAVHPQVAAALAQLGNMFNTARQGSTSVYPRSRYKSSRAGKQTRPESTQSGEGGMSELPQSQKTDVTKPEVDFQDCIDIVTKEENMRHLSQLVEQINDRHENNEDTASFVSAETFFENKTGFEEGLLQTSSYRQPFWPFLTMNGPKLLMTPSMMPLRQQSRGFLTSLSGGKNFGIGGKNKDKAEKKDKSGSHITTIELGEHLEKGKSTTINVHVKGEESESFWTKVQKSWLFRLLGIFSILYVAMTIYRQSNGKIPGVGVVGLSNNNFEINPEMVEVTFKDVKGINEVREELEELVDFLMHPEKFQKLGAKLPKGVLLVGPPGVGKTLVAKAIAGEAGVPFFHASGSEFDEIFVGMGAKRVRQLFSMAKMRSPSIIFIDEIDAVGHKRVTSPFTPHANQTINQLLSEMDGFSSKDGVIVIGATNKRDSLDHALTRPGRFDVEIMVGKPDIKGRRELFELYLKKTKCREDLDLNRLASLTYGQTGADISNVVNQAAIQAVKQRRELLCMDDLLYALDKLGLGPARKGIEIARIDKWSTAVHEAGHAIVALNSKYAKPINKVTVMPRGPALGHVSFLMEHDWTHSTTKGELLASMDVAFGGRVAEEMVNGADHVGQGCSADYQSATRIAESMVVETGMSEKLGFRVFDMQNKNMSPEQLSAIDGEINKLLKDSYERARKILETHKEEHKRLAEALMISETIDGSELDDILKGKKKVTIGEIY